MIKGKPSIKLFKCLLNYLFFIRMNKTKLYVSCSSKLPVKKLNVTWLHFWACEFQSEEQVVLICLKEVPALTRCKSHMSLSCQCDILESFLVEAQQHHLHFGTHPDSCHLHFWNGYFSTFLLWIGYFSFLWLRNVGHDWYWKWAERQFLFFVHCIGFIK